MDTLNKTISLGQHSDSEDIFDISIGVPVYNEEKNIGNLLKRLLSQKLQKFKIVEIFVISSGSTDRTNEIVEDFAKKDHRIKLLVQVERKGKASAINEFLKKATGEILILESGDTLPEKDTVENLCAPFSKNEIGMTGARPVPTDNPDKFLGFVVHFLWELHHRIALKSPKLGEMIAFRNVLKEIPEDSAVDEVSIEAIVRQKGYNLQYVPEAIVRNKGAGNVRDFLKRRRSIHAGHLHVKRTVGYAPTTMAFLSVFKVFISLLLTEVQKSNFKLVVWMFGAAFLEMAGRFLGMFDFYIMRKNSYKWDIAESTKEIKDDKYTFTRSLI